MIFFKALSLLPPIGKPIRADYFGDLFQFGDYFYVVATPGSLQIQEKIQTYEKFSKHFPSLPLVTNRPRFYWYIFYIDFYGSTTLIWGVKSI